jgi:hypothetical protein
VGVVQSVPTLNLVLSTSFLPCDVSHRDKFSHSFLSLNFLWAGQRGRPVCSIQIHLEQQFSLCLNFSVPSGHLQNTLTLKITIACHLQCTGCVPVAQLVGKRTTGYRPAIQTLPLAISTHIMKQLTL